MSAPLLTFPLITGLLTPQGQYHTAPVPVVEHNGRLRRVFADLTDAADGGKRPRAGMLSVPIKAYLLRATDWIFSILLPRNPKWLGGQFNAWLQGSAVLTRDGQIVHILRANALVGPERSAIVEVSADDQSVSFDPAAGIIDLPGEAKKFTIRYDAK